MKSVALLGTATTLSLQNLIAESALTPKPIGEGLLAVGHGEISRKKYPPRKITIPDVGAFKVLKGDFHMHTLFSDGLVMPKDRVAEAVDNGLDVIAITDHIEYRPFLGGNSIKLVENNDDHNIAYNIAKPEADKNNLILVRGTEITKQTCHFNALFVQDVNAIAAVVADWRKMLAISAEQGGFNFWNHPNFPTHDSLSDAVPFGYLKGKPLRFHDEIEEVRKQGHLHGIEAFNGTTYYPIVLDWCNERDLVPVTVTDIHPSDWNTYGHQNPLRPMSLILAKDRSYESVKEAFFAGRVVGWAANMVFGRLPWMEQLFRSSVEIQKTSGGLSLKNLSEIPCIIEVDDKSYPLESLGATAKISGATKLTVSNWFVGTKQPLEIEIQ